MTMTIEFLEEMFESLLEVLVEKGVITDGEIDAKLKDRFEREKILTKLEKSSE